MSPSFDTFRPSPDDLDLKMEGPHSPSSPLSHRRTPGISSSRTEREVLRKTNHSKIEKRRRKKTNEALAALRELVPQEDDHGADRKWEKEFKLEVLERTVAYLEKLTQRDRVLRARGCSCGRGTDVVGSSKRDSTVEEVADNVYDLRLPFEHLHGSASPVSTISGASTPTRLPPISSLFSPRQLPAPPNYHTEARHNQLPHTPPPPMFSPPPLTHWHDSSRAAHVDPRATAQAWTQPRHGGWAPRDRLS